MIFDFNQFINEGLIKTHSFDIIKSKEQIFLSKLKIKYKLDYFESNNVINLTLFDFNLIGEIQLTLETIESFLINMMGWFPSKMICKNLSLMENQFDYNKNYLIDNQDFLKEVKIIFESKFDIEKEIPLKLYHLSIFEYKNKILKSGLIPKSKSKLTYHPDRTYVCLHKLGCKALISNMKMFYKSLLWKNTKNKIDYRWVIYEIDTKDLDIKLYLDPNYIGGYYTLDNIPPDKIKIVEYEQI